MTENVEGAKAQATVISPRSGPAGGPPLVQVDDLKVHFQVGKGVIQRRGTDRVKAIDGVSFTIEQGSTLGIVGESGSGKSTLARVLMRMVVPTSGTVLVNGVNLQTASRQQLRNYRNVVQIVFQDPFSSLDPRMSVGNIIAEPLAMSPEYKQRKKLRARVDELLELVGLSPSSATGYPHQFSGGQRQRIAIARAISTNPRLLVLDEPTSALDVSVRAQILMLLKDLQSAMGLSFVIISHDLSTVAQTSTNVGVMYLGRMVEFGPARGVFRTPSHPYTQALLSSVPDEDVARPPRLADDYEIPSPLNIPEGCRFKTGCLLRRELGSPKECDTIDPPAHVAPTGQRTACHFPAEAAKAGAAQRS